jgi:hypothetical protein
MGISVGRMYSATMWYEIKYVNEGLKCVSHPTMQTYIFDITVISKLPPYNSTDTNEVSCLL